MYRIEDDIGDKELVIYSLKSKKISFVEMIYYTDGVFENFSNDGTYFIRLSGSSFKVYELTLNDDNGEYKYSLKFEKSCRIEASSISFTNDNQYMILSGSDSNYATLFSLHDFEKVDEDANIYGFYTGMSLVSFTCHNNGLGIMQSDQLVYLANYEEKCIVWMPYHIYSLSVKNIKYDENDQDNNTIKSLKLLAEEQNET